MSNLLKGSYIKDSGTRIINYNDLISNKIKNLKQQVTVGDIDSGFVEGLTAKAVESLIGDDDDFTQLDAFATRVEGNQEQVLSDYDEEAVNNSVSDAKSAEIVEKAMEEAEQIIAKAEEEAKVYRENAQNEGYTEGYNKGYQEGSIEGRENASREFDAKNQELLIRQQQLESEYNEAYKNIEPTIVNTILEVIDSVSGILCESNKDIVVHLINRALSKIEADDEYTIKVSKTDYEYVINNQAKLYGASSKNINIDIIEDNNLTQGQCMIETDGKIFDCSFDTTMKQLVEDIRLLSKM